MFNQKRDNNFPAKGVVQSQNQRQLKRNKPETGVKTLISGPEALYGAQGVEPGKLAAAAGRKIKSRSVLRAHELSRHQQDLLAQGVERGILKLRW